MSQKPKSCHVRRRVGVMFQHETATVSIESCHAAHGCMHHIAGLFIRQESSALVRPFVVLTLFPLVDVDSDLRPQGFGQHQHIIDLGTVGTHKSIFRHDRRGDTPNDGPRVEDGLAARDGTPGLGAGIAKPADHLLGADRTLVLRHISARRQSSMSSQSRNVPHTPLGLYRSLNTLAVPNPSLEVGRIHQGEEEVGRTDDDVTLRRFADAAIQRDPSIGGTQILAV